MTKSELVAFVLEGMDVTRGEGEEIVERVFEAMKAQIQGEGKFAYPRFGSLLLRERQARQGRNPRTGEPISIPASKTVVFRPAQALKDAL